MKSVRFVIMLLCVFYLNSVFAQTEDSINYFPRLVMDSNLYNFGEYTIKLDDLDESESVLYKNPEKEDSLNETLYKELFFHGATKTNYKKFIAVANSLWQLNEIEKAELMYKAVINSNQPFYTNTKYNWSGTAYGYGSFTSNYKNEAAIALARINIQKKNYRQALQYVTAAITRYKVYYTCGTGTMMYNNEIKALKSHCYQKLKMVDKGIELLLPYAFEGGHCCLTNLLKQKYSSKKLVAILKAAERTMTFIQNKDSSVTQVTRTGPNDSVVIEETRTYLSATATITLLGKKINIPSPELMDKEVATKEQFVAVFKNSKFYKDLME
jgi:tetratricopeptide (TPR) repeat protein